jgi:hypothetical protein
VNEVGSRGVPPSNLNDDTQQTTYAFTPLLTIKHKTVDVQGTVTMDENYDVIVLGEYLQDIQELSAEED